MERAIEVFAAITFIVIGISHVVLPRDWVEFFVLLRSKGTAGSFFNGLLTLSVGALIVSFHNVWSGIPLILTLVGWMQVLKGLLILVVPGHGIRTLAHVAPERAWTFQAAGAAFLLIGGLLVWHLLATPAVASA